MTVKYCEFCNEPFEPISNNQRYCKRPHFMICPICNNPYQVTNNENLKREPVACSYKCRAIKTRQTSLKKYGTAAPGNNPEARKKSRQTMVDRYGAEYTLQSPMLKDKVNKTVLEIYGTNNVMKNEYIKRKAEQTNLKRYGSKTYLTSEKGKAEYFEIMDTKYGVQYPIQNSEIKQKIENTSLHRYGAKWFPASEIGKQTIMKNVEEKYGVKYVTQLESVKQKSRETSLRHYGVSNPAKSRIIKKRIKDSLIAHYGTDAVMNIPEIRSKIMETSLKRYGVPFYIMSKNARCLGGAVSKLNAQFADKLVKAGIESKLEFNIGHKSYDIMIVSKNMLIELNPSYTHNLVGNHWNSNGLPLNYHQDKCKLAHSHDYNLECLFDWDSADNLVRQLSAPTRILDANSGDVYVLHRKTAIDFMSKFNVNRISKYPKKSMFLGLVFNNVIELAIAITFNHMPTMHTYQILDYGISYGLRCEGGFAKIVNFMQELIDLDDICFGIDADRINWNIIADFNLNRESITYSNPAVYWSKKDTRIPVKARMSNSDPLTSGWLPVEDCGKAILTF